MGLDRGKAKVNLFYWCTAVAPHGGMLPLLCVFVSFNESLDSGFMRGFERSARSIAFIAKRARRCPIAIAIAIAFHTKAQTKPKPFTTFD